ncbi:MAG: hypothetical protein NTY22_09980, partial [Proteobacteria bacterium]|nr:hypothetical protein [Pseudomonadota bacterium]
TFIPMLFTLLALWLFRVPAAAILSRHFGTSGIWWGIPIAWVVGVALAVTYYHTGRWKKKVIVKPYCEVPLEPEDSEAEWNCSKF